MQVPGDERECRDLWIAVLQTAIMDACNGKPGSLEQFQADKFLRRGGDLMRVAALAGLDCGPLVRQRYIAGQIDARLLFGNHARRAA